MANLLLELRYERVKDILGMTGGERRGRLWIGW